MAERWERLVAAVGEAMSMPGPAAEDYLRDTLGHDPPLLKEARDILGGGLAHDGFLTHGEATARPAPTLSPGAEIGGFRVQRLLGQGGMGAVFLAEQASPRRRVALKVLESALLSERARARFEYEVQALASLRHRGIAQVYETGVERIGDGFLVRDVPWFAMEYVEEASTLLQYAKAEALTTSQRLRLFLEVCEAVHHGHQKGVVHRDLKPENILVNRAGHPKVIDFGVARGVDSREGLATATGPEEIVGTVPYLSPERLTTGRGESDVRADVYALGVVLFQLLTGKLPIDVDPADIVTSARRVCEEPAPRPSTTNESVARDLDPVVLKALAKDPDARYGSAESLADDLRRFLDHRPVSARAPGAWYQFRLFARRHRALVASGVAILAVVIGAAVISVNWAVESQRSETRAVEQRGRAERLIKAVLDRSFDTTLREAPEIHKLQGGAVRVKAMMDSVLEDLGLLESMAGDDPRVQVLIAETWLRIGDTQGNDNFPNVGDREAAEASYRRALAMCQSVLQTHPAHRGARITAVRCRLRVTDVLDFAERALQKRHEQDPSLRAERRALLEVALAQAQRLHEDRKDRRAGELADAHMKVGRLDLDEARYESAREHARAVVDLYESGHVREVVMALELRAWSHHRAGEWKASREAWQAALVLRAKAAAGPDATYDDRFIYAERLGAHGEACFGSDDLEAATDSLGEAVRILELLRDEAADDKRVFIHLQIHLSELARVYQARCRDATKETRTAWLTAARDLLRRALEHLGPSGDGNRYREGMRATYRRDIERLESRLEDDG